jgi:hypothetical protein
MTLTENINTRKEIDIISFPSVDGYSITESNNQNNNVIGEGSVISTLIGEVRSLKEMITRGEKELRNKKKGHSNILVNTLPPRYLNQKEVIDYLGFEKVFRILVEEYGLKPIRQEHKCNVYCFKQVEEKCIQFEHSL